MTICSIASVDPTPALCRKWHDRHDIAAADTLGRQHRQLVVVIAAGYAPGGEPSPNFIRTGQRPVVRRKSLEAPWREIVRLAGAIEAAMTE